MICSTAVTPLLCSFELPTLMLENTTSKDQALHQQMTNIQGLLQNLTALQFNSHVYANHHHIYPIVAKIEDGSWVVCKQFPRTVADFVSLNGPDMLALQKFYSIPSRIESPVCKETPAYEIDNSIFIEIARAFGLAFWLDYDSRGSSENTVSSEEARAVGKTREVGQED